MVVVEAQAETAATQAAEEETGEEEEVMVEADLEVCN